MPKSKTKHKGYVIGWRLATADEASTDGALALRLNAYLRSPGFTASYDPGEPITASNDGL